MGLEKPGGQGVGMSEITALLVDAATVAAPLMLAKDVVRTLRSRMTGRRVARARAKAKARTVNSRRAAGNRSRRRVARARARVRDVKDAHRRASRGRGAADTPALGGPRLACSLFLRTRAFSATLRLKIGSAPAGDARRGA